MKYVHRFSSTLYTLRCKGFEFNLFPGSFVSGTIAKYCNTFARDNILLRNAKSHQTSRKIHRATKKGVYTAGIGANQSTKWPTGRNADRRANPKLF